MTALVAVVVEPSRVIGALAGAGLAAWSVAVVAGRLHGRAVRRRLRATVGVVPAGTARAGAVPVGVGPVGTARADTPRAGAVPVGVVPVGVARSRAVPSAAVPSGAARGGSLLRRGAPARVAGDDAPSGSGPGRRGLRPAGPWRTRGQPAGGGTDTAELAAACDAIARSLRGGESLAGAIAGAADRHRAPPIAEIAAGVRLGQHLPAVIDRVVAATHDADELLAVQVLAVAATHGGPQAEAIDRAASTLREREAVRAERLAQAASARISTRVMTVLPFGFTGFVAATDADVRAVLLRSPIGWTCLAVGTALNLAGRAWARRAVAA